MLSYAKVVGSINSNGQCMRKPTFRASAIFPAMESPGISTRINFLGYWMIKRGIPEVTAVVTIRSTDGTVLHRSTMLIKERKAYRVEVADELVKGGVAAECFSGSIEVEFFSARDLVFAYPAVVVNYYGPAFSTFVHTAQRVFNDVDDAGEALETSVPESGFNIYANSNAVPFFSFINGFERVPDGSVRMKFFNHKGETFEHEMSIGSVRPYQMVTVQADKELDLEGFLDGRAGTMSTNFNVRWIFPRVVAGNRQLSLNALSITHTFYDCALATTAGDYWPEPPEESHAASLMIPLALDDRHVSKIHFYPIISPSIIDIDVEVYSAEGSHLGTVRDALRIQSPNTQLNTISLGLVCEQIGVAGPAQCSAKIVARPAPGSRLPSRIKMGVDVGIEGAELPCNICVSLLPFSPAMDKARRSFRWAPLFADQPGAMAWILNGSPAKKYAHTANVEITFYREKDEATLTRKVQIPPHALVTIGLDDDRELAAFFEQKPGWFVAIADTPYVTTFYFVEHPSGMVGGDHGF